MSAVSVQLRVGSRDLGPADAGIDWPDDPLDPAYGAAMDEWEAEISRRAKPRRLLSLRLPGFFIGLDLYASDGPGKQLDSSAQLDHPRVAVLAETLFGVPRAFLRKVSKLLWTRSYTHQSSPSLGVDNQSVGDGPAPGRHTPGAGNTSEASA